MPTARKRCAPGAVLLEVVVACGLLVFGLAAVGFQITTALDAARSAELGTRALMLADIKLAEVRAAVLRPKRSDDELKGDFGILYPGYTWRITVEPTEIDEFFMITLEIGFNPKLVEDQIDDPDFEIDIEDEGTQIVRTAYCLMPKPADVDLERDFGLDLEEFAGSLGEGGSEGGQDGSGAAGPGAVAAGTAGPGRADGHQAILNLVTQFLSEHPEIINDAGGIDLDAVAKLPPEELAAVIDLFRDLVGRSDGIPRGLARRMGREQPGEGRGGRGGRRGGEGGELGEGPPPPGDAAGPRGRRGGEAGPRGSRRGDGQPQNRGPDRRGGPRDERREGLPGRQPRR